MSHTLLDKLKSAGAVVEVINDKLRIDAPTELLTTELIAELKANKDSIIQELRLADYQQRAWVVNSLTELFNLLKEFGQHKWCISQQSDMSAAYTARALELIATEQADKWKTLENLAHFCWKGSAT